MKCPKCNTEDNIWEVEKIIQKTFIKRIENAEKEIFERLVYSVGTENDIEQDHDIIDTWYECKACCSSFSAKLLIKANEPQELNYLR